MERQSKNPVLSALFADAFLGAFLARPAGALMVDGAVALFTAGPDVITPQTLLADFTEASFDDYTRQPLLLADYSPPINAAGFSKGMGANVLFVAGASLVLPGQTVIGYGVVDGGYAYLMYSELFEVPVPFGTPGAFLDLFVMIGVTNPFATGL